MDRLGIGFTGESSREVTLEKMIEIGREAELRNFESIWVAEDYYYRDAISRLTALALSTKTVRLATGVINPESRSPPLIAMTIGTLDEISHSRMILGLGASLRLWLYEKHRPQLKHLEVMRESVQVIRELIAGEKVNFSGKILDYQNLSLGFNPERSKIPIYIAAMGPKMVQLAGEIADGVLLTAGTTPEFTQLARENLRIGAEKAGRDPRDVDLAALVITSISDDRNKARELVREEIAFLSILPRMNTVLEVSGLLKLDSVPKIREAGATGDIKKAARYVDDALTDALTVAGSTDDCRRGIQRLRKAGLKLPILVPMTPAMFPQAFSRLSP